MKMVFGIIYWYAHAKVNLKNSIKGLLYDFEKKMKNFIFQFFDENLLSASGGGGRTRLPKFKLFGKISHRFTRDFTNTDKKIRK